MTTPQVIQWTHVDDQTPPVGVPNVAVKILERDKFMFGAIKEDPDSELWSSPYHYRVLTLEGWRSISHWAIIAPPEVKL